MTAETHGPQLPPEPKRPKPPWREIEARWLIGELGRDDICRIYGLARTTVFAHLRREKLQERRAEYTEALRREVVERTAGPIAERVLDQLTDVLNDLRAIRRAAIAGLLQHYQNPNGEPPIAEVEIRGTARSGSLRTKRLAYRFDSPLAVRALRVEADLLLRLGKGIRLLEPDVVETEGAKSPHVFVQQVIEAGRAIDAAAASAEELSAPPAPDASATSEDPAPDGAE